MTGKQIEAAGRSGRWQRLHPGCTRRSAASPGRAAMLWAAVLRAGPKAVLSHYSAAELHGAGGHARPGHPRHGAQPAPDRADPRRRPALFAPSWRRTAIPSCSPPQTRVEETVLDLADGAASLDEALGWMFRACGSRQDHAGPDRRRHGPAGPDAVADGVRGGARPRCAGGSLAAGVPVRQPGGAAPWAAGRCPAVPGDPGGPAPVPGRDLPGVRRGGRAGRPGRPPGGTPLARHPPGQRQRRRGQVRSGTDGPT